MRSRVTTALLVQQAVGMENDTVSKELTTGFFPERFTVSAEGMSDLSRDRFEGLIYELAQNVFDEDSATFARPSTAHFGLTVDR